MTVSKVGQRIGRVVLAFRSRPGRRDAPLVVVLVVMAALAGATPAAAETAGVGWEAFPQVYPTVLHPGGGEGTIQIGFMNVGAKPSSGAVTVTDTLPAGLAVVAAGGMPAEGNTVEAGGGPWSCGTAEIVEGGRERERVTCVRPELILPSGKGEEAALGLGGYEAVERVGVVVAVGGGVREGALENVVTIAGGGASGVSRVVGRVMVGSSEPEFGFSDWDVWFSNADGSVDTQAGSHPYEATFAVGFNEDAGGALAGGEPRNIETELPPGFFGEPNVVPRCTRERLDATECPAGTQVGSALVARSNEHGGGPEGYSLRLGIYNVVPPPGVAAQFAFKDNGNAVYLDAGPRGYGKYGLVAHLDDIPGLNVVAAIMTFWGVPPEPSHDPARQASGSLNPETNECNVRGCPSFAPERPFLTLPTSCGSRSRLRSARTARGLTPRRSRKRFRSRMTRGMSRRVLRVARRWRSTRRSWSRRTPPQRIRRRV
jgi:hypothetical protein